LAKVLLPADLEATLEDAWEETRKVPGHLAENEARFLGLLAACTPAKGTILEIGSFKGRSTVMLAKVASHYGSGRVVAVDPHDSPILLGQNNGEAASSLQSFLNAINAAGISSAVEPHVAPSGQVSVSWNRPLRLLWIDGDHSYEGAKADLDGFLPHLVSGGIVAIHDALNVFPGPIRVFVEDILQSDRFGAAGFVHSIAWAQFRPDDGHLFRKQRLALARKASRLLPFVKNGAELRGLTKRRYKVNRFLVPHWATTPHKWAALLNRS
jgi:predicted O-methyltransferase YrrM